MVHLLNILGIIFMIMPCFAAQEPLTKRCKKESVLLSLQELATCSVVNMLESVAIRERFKKNPSEISNMLVHVNPEVERLIAVELLKKYKAYITAAHITLQREIDNEDGNTAQVLTLNKQGSLLAGGGLCLTICQNGVGMQGFVKVWGIAEKVHSLLFEVKDFDVVTALCFNVTSDYIAVGQKHGDLVIVSLDGATRNILHDDYSHAQNAQINALNFMRDGTRLASACEKGFVCVWNTSTGQLLQRLEHAQRSYFLGPIIPCSIVYVQLHDDGTVFSAENSWGYIWNSRGEKQTSFPCLCAQKVENSDRGYFMWKNTSLDLYDVDAGKSLGTKILCEKNQNITQVCSKLFSSDGSSLAISFSDGTVSLYDCPSYEQVIEELTLTQALYVVQKLQEKLESSAWRDSMPFKKFFLQQESDEGKCIAESLPDVFKKLI